MLDPGGTFVSENQSKHKPNYVWLLTHTTLARRLDNLIHLSRSFPIIIHWRTPKSSDFSSGHPVLHHICLVERIVPRTTCGHLLSSTPCLAISTRSILPSWSCLWIILCLYCSWTNLFTRLSTGRLRLCKTGHIVQTLAYTALVHHFVDITHQFWSSPDSTIGASSPSTVAH